MTTDVIGGYRFCPQTSLGDALSIFVCGISVFSRPQLILDLPVRQDLETMLSSAERPPRPPQPPVLHDIMLDQYDAQRFPVDVVTISQFPHRAAHVKLQQGVKPANLVSAGPTHDGRTKRIMREVRYCCLAFQFHI